MIPFVQPNWAGWPDSHDSVSGIPGTTQYIRQIGDFVAFLDAHTEFYRRELDSYDAAHQRARFLKDAFENRGCHKIFYVNGTPIERETDLQILYRLTWYGTRTDVTREANDGRGPADFKVSRGAKDKSLVEMKPASNAQLERNLRTQYAVYEKASDPPRSVKIVIYFSEAERRRGPSTSLRAGGG